MAGKADTGNAQIRRDAEPKRKRESDSVAAEDARRLLDDPAFKKGVDRVRDGLVAELEKLQSDGQPETEAYERELCRALRTLKRVTRAISTTVQGQALRIAEFKPQPIRDEGEGE